MSDVMLDGPRTHQKSSHIRSANSMSATTSSVLHRRPTLKSKLAYLPVLQAPRRTVTLEDTKGDLGDPNHYHSAEIHNTRPILSNTTPTPCRASLDSYFQVPHRHHVGNNADSATPAIGPITAIPAHLSGVRLYAMQSAMLLPPSPLDLSSGSESEPDSPSS